MEDDDDILSKTFSFYLLTDNLDIMSSNNLNSNNSINIYD
jgi:hypothetical protein